MLFAYRGLRVTNICTANIAFTVAILVLLLSAFGRNFSAAFATNVTFEVSILILVLCALRRLRSLKLFFTFIANVVAICVNVLCAGLTTPSPQATRSKCCHKHTAYDQKC
jgi:hypothetical protein